jgi:hypothetical protein
MKTGGSYSNVRIGQHREIDLNNESFKKLIELETRDLISQTKSPDLKDNFRRNIVIYANESHNMAKILKSTPISPKLH